jgi:outer membrane receptor protein involved in Fe transport
MQALVLAAALLAPPVAAAAQQAGSIRGVVYDADFEVPLPGAQVTIVESAVAVTTSDQGTYRFESVAPGTYTLVFSKDGYARQVRPDVVVTAGQLTDVDASLAGEFTDLEEFVVQDILQAAGATEEALLQLRLESPALMDSIGAELMSKAGASDAAAALKLVAGATVKDGKSAVIRGLPDRYVSSQMNSVRLPSADEDKRAVELDQFPAAVIESIQISKTFTPDQQGDASGGAVDVRLRGIPEETVLQFRAQLGYNANAGFRDDFLSYEGGGFDSLGRDDQDRVVQPDGNWEGAVAATEDDSPVDYKFGLDAGRRWELASGMKVGGLVSLFYEKDSEFREDYVDNSLIRENREDPTLEPEIVQGSRADDNTGDYRTALFDIEQASQSVRLGGLATIGLETESHALALTYLYARNTTDTATLATDTRGKEFFFPGHDPDDPTSPGHGSLESAPYIRTDTLLFSERNSDTLQLSGRHTLPFEGLELGSAARFGKPELDWVLAHSTASLDQPDGRQFSAIWQPFGIDSGIWSPYKPAASFRLGNLQRTFEELEEESDQYLLDLKFPFEQRNGRQGYLKLGLFDDEVDRTYEQDTFSNFDDNSFFIGGFDEPWVEVFPDEDHPISASSEDIDYDGEQDISAWYAMVDTPLSETVGLVAGVRFESTKISTIVDPETDARWLDPNGVGIQEDLEPGEADVFFEQDDVLPAFGLTYQPIGPLTFRASYAETVARQTFKELTPVLVYEYAGGPVFSGNPDLQMSNLKNYDLRVDYTPREGSFFSFSWFHKDIEKPIEYVQIANPFVYTTAVNYPDGELGGYEIELRQDLDRFAEGLEGLSIGANATFIDSEVTLPADEAQILEDQLAPEPTRDATNAPEYLYNLYVTYEHEKTQVSLFYTVQGDTLLAGAGAKTGSIGYVPDVYQEDYGTLNLVISRQIGKHTRIKFEAKNLTDPDIETVYRSEFIGGDVTKSSYSTGREFSISIGFNL